MPTDEEDDLLDSIETIIRIGDADTYEQSVEDALAALSYLAQRGQIRGLAFAALLHGNDEDALCGLAGEVFKDVPSLVESLEQLTAALRKRAAQ